MNRSMFAYVIMKVNPKDYISPYPNYCNLNNTCTSHLCNGAPNAAYFISYKATFYINMTTVSTACNRMHIVYCWMFTSNKIGYTVY